MSSNTTCPNCGSVCMTRDQAEEGYICLNCQHHFPYGEAEEEFKYSLDLVDWGLVEIPEWVFERNNLKKLDMSAEPYDPFHAPFINRISSIPPKIGLMTDLEELDLSGNMISLIPPEIKNCKSLRELYLGRNTITKIPEEFCELRNLEALNLRYNSIKSLPDKFGSLANLKFLNLEGNNILTLPGSFTKLVNLEDLIIAGNPELISPPYDIALKGIHAINVWFEKSGNE